MDDNAGIAARIERLRSLLRTGRDGAATSVMADLADAFSHHAAVEGAGLFAELRRSGVAADVVRRLTEEADELCRLLDDLPVHWRRRAVESVMTAVLSHRDLEDRDLYPRALRELPLDRWGPIDDRQQWMLTH